jgi:radical SAM superfamily enzyme YgiQ (UPF0313 family)
MKVLFVYSNNVRDFLPAPPIGLSYVASNTVDAGHTVQFLDLLRTKGKIRRLKSLLNKFTPDVVAFSVRNIDNVLHQRLITHLDHISSYVAVVRKESSAQIVIGGSAISILGKQALEVINADYAVTGEGESVFIDLLEKLSQNLEPSLPGVYCKKQLGDFPINSKKCLQFRASGMECWVKWKPYERAGATWPIQSRRGCPHQCTYCPYPLIEGRKLRWREIGEVVDEIEKVSRTVGPRCFEFVDSVFNEPENYACSLCEEIIRRKLKVNLTTMGINVKYLSSTLLSLMRQAGFNSLMITPESGSDIVLERMKKGFTKEEVIKSAELLRQHGIPAMWFFMLGAPGETEDTVHETMELVKSHLNYKSALNLFTTGIRILPGTELAQQAIIDGVLKPDDDLSQSHFYFSPKTTEQWLLQQVDQLVAECPSVVHAAQDPSVRPIGRFIFYLLHIAGISPPYWRFFSRFLFVPQVHRARTRA